MMNLKHGGVDFNQNTWRGGCYLSEPLKGLMKFSTKNDIRVSIRITYTHIYIYVLL